MNNNNTNDREFIEGMLKAFSSIHKDSNKGFSDDVYELATDPNVSFVEMRRRFDQICKENGIPMSEGIKKFQARLNQAAQKEEDSLVSGIHDNVDAVGDNIVAPKSDDKGKPMGEVAVAKPIDKIVAEKTEKPLPNTEVVEELLEEKVEKPITTEEIKEVEVMADTMSPNAAYKNNRMVLTVSPQDSIDSIGNQLMTLKSQGVDAEVNFNGMLLSNTNFNNVDQIKKDYYAQETKKLKDFYNEAALNKEENENINMSIVSPKGEDNKRVVMINNSNNPSISTMVQFDNGVDFDHYVMPDLIDAYVPTDSKITEIDDELGISRGHNFAVDNQPQDRYLYMAQMSNGNQLALNMEASSIDQAKTYINERLENVTKEVNEEANKNMADAAQKENENELEKENNKVKKLKFEPNNNGFVNGIGIGVIAGISIVIIIVLLLVFKVL